MGLRQVMKFKSNVNKQTMFKDPRNNTLFSARILPKIRIFLDYIFSKMRA